jgi:four helix bundle protein
MTLVKEVYSLLKQYPQHEQYAICDQMRRSSVSVPSNIAEGTSKTSPKEQYHFLEIAYGSLMELMCQLEISHDLTYITQEQFNSLEEKVFTIFKMLSSMQTSLRSRIQNA